MTAASETAKHGVDKGLFIAIPVTLIAWASAFVVIRGVAPYFSGGSIALGRLIVGTVVLGIVVIVGRRWVWPTRREWLQIVVFGAAWFGGYNVCLSIAEHTLDAGTTALLVNIGPILLALGAGIFLREGIPRWLAIGGIVAFAGVALIAVASGVTFTNLTGVLWCLLAAVAYSVGVLFQKPTLRRLPAAQVTWMGCAVGMIVCLPFAGQLAYGLAAAPTSAWLGILYLGAIPTSVAFSTWAYALSRMPAGRLGVSTYVVPVIAIILSLIFFAVVPPILAIVGGAICLVGVALSRRRSPERGVSEVVIETELTDGP